ncbi:MAG: aspartate carbamoyltransferase catalytic subunit [Ilumatobacteraceae bacterium]|nr:aspartate carbamoyltransferase catalytic subunit [Ilumatobacteraceae bacterium]
MKHLLSAQDLTQNDIIALLDMADHMAEINTRPVPKVPALRGKTVVSVFFEDSTRTRLSFETAAKRLSADTMTFSASTSSLNKGESLRDTIETLSAMRVDAFVVRHKSSGVPLQITEWTDASVINAGDGWHQHPTQALTDAFTITRSFGTPHTLEGRTIAIVGDVLHSRVARSNIAVLTKLGAKVVLVGPSTLIPIQAQQWPVEILHSLDEVVAEVDVVYMLRMQRERMETAFVPSLGEYTARFGLTPDRVSRMLAHALVMHPGPMNRGIDMVVDPAQVSGSRILQQVTNGIPVRMAVLFTLLGSGGSTALATGADL